MKKNFVYYLIFLVIVAILLDSTKLRSGYVNKSYFYLSPENLSASIFRKPFRYFSKKYEIFLLKYTKKHKEYWSLESDKDRKNLKKKYTINKNTNNLTKNISQNPLNFENWERSHGNNHSNRFSNLKLINKENIRLLEVAWIYHSNNKKSLGIDIQCNPIIINGTIYSPIVNGNIVALDGYTGQEIWKSSMFNADVARRGLVYWEGNSLIKPQIFFNDGSKLISLNAKDGSLNKNFGKNGRVSTGYSKITPIIYKNSIIVASWKKDLEVYDISTGKLKWKYFFGDKKNEINGGKKYINEGGNPWGGISADIERGIVYITTGNASKYFDGSKRPGYNKNSSSLLAIDLEKKKELWSFQETSHDIWNYDMPGPPILTSININSNKVDVVIAVTKRANTIILDRITGQNIFDLNYQIVETSKVPGEKTSPYQLNLELPEAFGKNIFNKNDVTNISADSESYINYIVNNSQFGFFKPISLDKNTIIYNFHGGAEWMGASIDSDSQTMYVNNNNIAWNAKLIKKENINEYESSFSRLLDQDGYPGTKPPWGTLSSMNLNTGKLNWTVPFGYYPELKKKNIITGTENFGGVTATKSGLVFATGTLDSNIYAYDNLTGKELWLRKLPFIGSAPPSVYLAKNEQFIIVQSTGSNSLNQGYPNINKFGDAIVAFKLRK